MEAVNNSRRTGRELDFQNSKRRGRGREEEIPILKALLSGS